MWGEHAGVGALLRERNPFTIDIHCLAHKLASDVLVPQNIPSQSSSLASYGDEQLDVLNNLQSLRRLMMKSFPLL